MASPRAGFARVLDAKDKLILQFHRGHHMVSLHGKLIMVGRTVYRARARGTTMGQALARLWSQVEGKCLIEEREYHQPREVETEDDNERDCAGHRDES